MGQLFFGIMLGVFATLLLITGGFLVIEITAIRVANKIKEEQEDEK